MTHTPPAICFYFQVHQPYRLKDIRTVNVGMGSLDLFDEEKNRSIFRKVAEKCYLPTNRVWQEILRENPQMRIAFSLSGTFLDQCREYGRDVLNSFRALAQTGQVEFLGETYEHTLSSLFSPLEFAQQVKRHAESIAKEFGIVPTIFRNTELITSNEIAAMVRNLGFRGMLSEGVDRLLHHRPPTAVFTPASVRLPTALSTMLCPFAVHTSIPRSLSLLLKHYQLSDDIAFRFGDKAWPGYPLTAERFSQWVAETPGFTVNLFMDYETFGEHQWSETGIFEFLRALPHALQERGIVTRTPSETIDAWRKRERKAELYDMHMPISWADRERDLSAWMGNTIQDGATRAAYAMEKEVKRTNNAPLLQTWRRLLTSDHVYYMCTKYWSDGDVHKYFSPYSSPYEAFRRFSNALVSLKTYVANSGRKSVRRNNGLRSSSKKKPRKKNVT